MENKNNGMDRRTFLKTTGIGGASLALTTGLPSKILAAESANDSLSKEMPTRILGKTGVPVTILDLGGIIDWTTNFNLLSMAFNMGVTCWDTSDDYENGKSEIGIGQYFTKYPENRKKIFLITKVSRTTDPKEMTQLLNQSFERMKTDWVDIIFIHNVRGVESFTPEVKAWVEQKKKEGKIKFFGYSAHVNNSQILMQTSTMGWIDALMMTYNYRTRMDDDINKGIDACAKAGIGLIAMKVMGMNFGRGGGASQEELPVITSLMEKGLTMEQAKLKAIWQDERIATCCVAMKNLTVLKDNVAAATDKKTLSSSDIKMLTRLAESTCNQYCHGCGRCESVMDSESRIPDVLRYMMYFNSYGERDQARRQFRELPEGIRNNLVSRDYSPAERICPHRIQIGEAMKEAVRILA
jgi:predicted aldo/keto reductase-like oxidoreductase